MRTFFSWNTLHRLGLRDRLCDNTEYEECGHIGGKISPFFKRFVLSQSFIRAEQRLLRIIETKRNLEALLLLAKSSHSPRCFSPLHQYVAGHSARQDTKRSFLNTSKVHPWRDFKCIQPRHLCIWPCGSSRFEWKKNDVGDFSWKRTLNVFYLPSMERWFKNALSTNWMSSTSSNDTSDGAEYHSKSVFIYTFVDVNEAVKVN